PPAASARAKMRTSLTEEASSYLRPCMTAVVTLPAQPDLDADFATHLPYVQEETLAPLGASSEDMEHRVEQAKLGLRYHQRRTSTPLDARAVHLTIEEPEVRTSATTPVRNARHDGGR
ncbi:hypothetical protein BKA93DRAFT_872290, partial [Sparassis latifolia]